MAQFNEEITLLPAEELARELLLECAAFFPGLEIWVASGWVRGRLLGLPSSDVDLALSNTTRKVFVAFLETVSAQPDVVARYRRRTAELGIADSLFARFHVVKRNVGAAKKLETAGGKLFAPGRGHGELAEGGVRRGEPQPRNGVRHGRGGCASTRRHGECAVLSPGEARGGQVLRLVRIGSKLGFTIDPAVMACMRDVEIQRLLEITRDRIGAELLKMMQSANPKVAFQHIYDANYMLLSPSRCRPVPWPAGWSQSFQMLSRILNRNDNLCKLVRDGQDIDLVWAMAAYTSAHTPLGGLRHTNLREAVQEAINTIRYPVNVSQLLESLLQNFDAIDTRHHGSPAQRHGSQFHISFVYTALYKSSLAATSKSITVIKPPQITM